LYPILNHNRDDILSLYLLTSVSSSLITQYLGSGGNDDDLLLSLAEIYFNQRDYQQAIDLIDKINTQFASSTTLKQASMMKAVACKRLGRWQEAVASFAAINSFEPEVESLIEQAKIYEHKLKDLDKALETVRQAESILELMSYMSQDLTVLSGQLSHRKNRLQRKVYRLLHI
jgi:tetratricopeptide (TPR) repeat protein